MFEFKITSHNKNTKARTGEFHTPHGVLQTPALATVATEGRIRGLEDLSTETFPLPYTIVNTFHIFTKNILEKIGENNTVHNYGKFPGVVASDSGGFQVFSLGFGKAHSVGKLSNTDKAVVDSDNPLIISEEGVTFSWNPYSESKKTEESLAISLTPEKSMEIQARIGADINFAFDECTSPFNSKEYTAESVERTHRWLKRCAKRHEELKPKRKYPQALFAVIQGGQWEDLRVKSAQLCASVDVPGFGIGGSFGSSFGDSKQNMHKVLEWIMPHLPDEKPRHLLGIGQVDDLFECVERGVDLFDCVIPTREARHKVFYTKNGKVALKHIKLSNDPIVIGCKCIACSQKIGGQQLYELFLKKDPLAFYYSSAHNIQFFADLMEEIRLAIKQDSLSELKNEYKNYLK